MKLVGWPSPEVLLSYIGSAKKDKISEDDGGTLAEVSKLILGMQAETQQDTRQDSVYLVQWHKYKAMGTRGKRAKPFLG